MAYELVLRRAVALKANSLNRPQRRRFEAFLDSLATSPSQQGDFQDADETGRTNEVKVVYDLLVTYWVDHAVREIRVLDLELLEDSV